MGGADVETMEVWRDETQEVWRDEIQEVWRDEIQEVWRDGTESVQQWDKTQEGEMMAKKETMLEEGDSELLVEEEQRQEEGMRW